MEYNLTEGRHRRQRIIALKSTQVFLIAAVILLTLAVTVLCIGLLVRYEVETDVWDAERVSFWQDELSAEQKIWFDDGIDELREALKVNWKSESTRNVVVFVTHGVDAAAQATVRFGAQTQRAGKLLWENFQHVGHILQPCNDPMTCDVHSFSTGLFSGIQTTSGLGGLASTALQQNCAQSMNESFQIKSILRLAQERNLRTGFVTTRRVSGPTMAALYAHTPDTSWECDSKMSPSKLLQGCTDIATQLIDGETGSRINVIMGGGRQALLSSTPSSSWDPVDTMVCNAGDGRNYLRHWRTMKMLQQQKSALLQNAPELSRLNGSKVDYVLGVFANGNITPPWSRNSSENHMPELSSMVIKALEVLKRPESGFLLIVESGNSGGDIAEQFNELKRLNDTIYETSKRLSSDTLMIVVLNSAQPEPTTTSLSESELGDGQMPSSLDDVNIFSKGPSSYLLQGIYEDTYLAHVVSFSLKMGQFQDPISKKNFT